MAVSPRLFLAQGPTYYLSGAFRIVASRLRAPAAKIIEDFIKERLPCPKIRPAQSIERGLDINEVLLCRVAEYAQYTGYSKSLPFRIAAGFAIIQEKQIRSQ
jgi:hypothetical protein